jgi:hypothetical protein
MPAAIRPYSIAVAPVSSFAKRLIRLVIGGSFPLLRGRFLARAGPSHGQMNRPFQLRNGRCRHLNSIAEMGVQLHNAAEWVRPLRREPAHGVGGAFSLIEAMNH